jgi:hypothetical protein
VHDNHNGDGRRVILDLDANDIGYNVPDIEVNKKPVRRVLLSTSTSATIKGGKALVRTNKSRTSKEDWHALVPYALDEPSVSSATPMSMC